MRRTTLILTATLLTLALNAGAALAMQPPGHGDVVDDLFGCVNGDPVPGHPGAAGLVDATYEHAASPTAWNAVFNTDVIANSCAE